MAITWRRLRSALSLGGMGLRELGVKTWKLMDEHEIQTRAAAISFYAMLAMVPFIGLVLTLAIQLLPDLTGASKDSRGLGNMTVEQLTTTLGKLLPQEAANEIKGPDHANPARSAGRIDLGRAGHYPLAGLEPLRGGH